MAEDKDMTREQTKQGADSTDADKSKDMHEAGHAEDSSCKQDAAAGNAADTDDAADKTAAGEQSSEVSADKDEGDTADADSSSADADDNTDDKAGEASSKSDKKDKQIEELNDKYKRLFAEFDNFRKRSEAEKTGMFAEGEKTVLLKVLPLIDNFERALDSIPEEQKGTALADGIDKTYKAFLAQLTELGVTPIEARGKSFDANLHNAVMHVEDDSIEDNIVVEEFQKGYMFKDKVLRYSMVKVAN